MSSRSRIPGFYKLNIDARRQRLAELCGLDPSELTALDRGGLDVGVADTMIENVVGTYSLPFGVALNFVIDGKDVIVPMAIEEPSVVAAASNAARMVRAGGGFRTEVSEPVMIAQIELREVPDPRSACRDISDRRDQILSRARDLAPGVVSRGGGPVGLETRVFADDRIVVVHLLVDCRDAMGANIVNSIAEGVADDLAKIAGATIGLRILSNLSVHRTVVVTATAPDDALCPDAGAEVRGAIAAASRFAELDPYRAATHNKGIMNGVDAVLVATANDWRSVEAGAHAYACQTGTYRPLALWTNSGSAIEGRLEMPLAVGTVGGAISVHAGARLALAILGDQSAGWLAAVAGAAGLATNLAALRALATDGIQRGHMSLHARKETSS